MQLKAMVVGSGWAAEGHTMALRASNVDVVALCGRSAEPTYALARRLDVPSARLDWESTLSEFHPDIVSIAVPAVPHEQIAVAAANSGCHIFCDKPLALDAEGARTMLAAVRRAGVKHAYGPASCLAPAITLARDLLANGLIGELTGIENSVHFGVSFPFAFGWPQQLSQGGGLLNNLLTHKLAQVLRLTDGTLTHVAGQARSFVARAPLGPPVHDFRELFRPVPDVDENDPAQWRATDADTAYSVVLQILLPTGGGVSAALNASLTSKSPQDETLALYGTKGTLLLGGGNSPTELRHYDFRRDSWVQLAIPPSGEETHTPVDTVQRDWDTLIRRFLADIRSEEHDFYPTFADGWLAAEVIDIVRAGRGLTAVPTTP